MSKVVFLLTVLMCALVATAQVTTAEEPTQGSLIAYGKDGAIGACPLKSTAVRTEISGFMARVRVRQEFENSYSSPIEAVYTFPLSNKGAVDDMTMTIGSRTIRGTIMKREQARAAYEQAKADGKTASLLDQERPSIFTQSVANIMPGEKIIVEISYVETLKYEDGSYEFVFPMTVGPRYIPASVPDAAKISPPIAVERPGHDISIEVNLNAGVPVESIRSASHDIQQVNFSPARAQVTLKNEKVIPNKDFILRYDVTGGKIQDAVLAHRDARGGFFTMILQPPDKAAAEDRTPKEIVFVLDTSGSMSGFPIEKAKEAMKLSLEGLYPEDTFNFITFAGDTHILFEQPVYATQNNLARALEFLGSRRGHGGTEMMTAIKAALDPTDSQSHLRIVCFMTDGFVGNEDEIIAEVQRHPNARVFSFGIGSSVNRHLLDKIAEAGRGEAEYVGLEDDGSRAAKKFYERVRTPLLTDISIDWNGLPVADVYPNRLTDLFSAKPVVVHGRYTKPVNGVARLRGNLAGQEYVREIAVNLPEAEAANDSLASLWARTRIDELSSEKLGARDQARAAEFDKTILGLGLEFRLMTALTSFVAVEDRIVNHEGKPTTVQVPVALPDGVEADSPFRRTEVVSSLQRAPNIGGGGGGGNTSTGSMPPATGTGIGYGSGYGSGSGSGTGNGSGSANVVVSASEAVTVDSTDAQLSSTITLQDIQSLPVNTRQSLMMLSGAGLTSAGPPLALQIDGASGSENTFTIDGVENVRRGPTVGRTVLIVDPIFPDPGDAKPSVVEVAIEVDPWGTVVKANAVSGPTELRKSAESAAALSRFAPSYERERAVRFTAKLVYKAANALSTQINLRDARLIPLTASDRRMFRLGNILHVWLYGVAARISNGVKEPTLNEATFARDGKASVRIQLSKRASSVAEKLKNAGVDIESMSGNSVRGRIEVAKLSKLADIDAVKYVYPVY